jgi:F420-non-reducing hydrogenase small subunit
MASNGKPKLALYWASSCGGCEIAVLAIHEKILEVADAFDIVFWPCVMDFKEEDIKAMDDQSIDVCLFNGAIRNDDNEQMAHLLRQKSKVMVAFGSCAMEGCMPGLGNFADRQQMMNFIYHDSPSTDNPEGIEPRSSPKLQKVN